jgi:hypothetical protein
MSTHEGWIELVDREGIITFIADGAYVRYGWPVHVTIERSDGRYQVSWFNEDDGASAAASGQKDLDRAGLERFLEELLADGRPVERTGL